MNPMITSDIDLPVPEADSDLDEKQPDEVANITPDESMDGQPDGLVEPKDALPLADDFEAMRKEYFKIPEDLESVAETTYTWHIEDWEKLPDKLHSDGFECGDATWKVLFFPYGNTQRDQCSFYLEHGLEEGQKAPENWYACLQFMLVLWNPSDPSIHVENSATHRFSGEDSDWGFTRFVELRRLNRFTSEGKPLLDEGAANLTAYVRVIKDPTGVLWHNFSNYDSKKETGMVGLKNQGATCYLNSLLQSLFFTNAFRKAIYQIPTAQEADVRNNSAYALQRLYYMLQKNETAVSTSELTTSFGWESRQIFEQQDVQELSRILMDKMEERMKNTPAEKVLPELFVGRMKTYIDCINVDYESSRREDFWDIQLNVRGNATLDDSFKDYVSVETMDGDNKYFAEGHGLQDARKGVIFESLPQVLHLQLKRFEYNFQADAMTKVYDRYEFPEVWDASPYLSDTADRSEPHIYHLHGVLVHSGDLNAGHYYAFLKPDKNGHFYKFDDDRVTRATPKEAMDENFGGDFAPLANGTGGGQRNPYTRTWSKQRFMSAYMLVYIRESRLDSVLQEVVEDDIPPHLARNIDAELAEAEQKRKDREEAHLYMQVVIGTTANFQAHQGFDVFPATTHMLDKEHPSLPKVLRLLKTMTVGTLKELLSDELGVEKELLRPWGLVGRQNVTVRPDTPLVWDDATLEESASKLQSGKPLRLWIELGSRDAETGAPAWPSYEALTDYRNDKSPILLFLKYFNAEEQTLKGVGHIYMPKNQRIYELGPHILTLMGWPEGTAIKLFEEIKVKMIDPMKTNTTFASSELQHGDIVCFEKLLPDAELTALEDAGKYTEPQSFYNYLGSRIEVWFSDRNSPDRENAAFKLELSRISTYDQLALKVADHLKVEPTYLRFSTVNAQTNKPRTFVKRGPPQTLNQIFSSAYSSYISVTNQRSDWLFFEVLDMPLSELENKKLLKISLVTEGITKEEVIETLVPKTGTIADIPPALAAKAKSTNNPLPPELLESLRFYEAPSGRIIRELVPTILVAPFTEWTTIYAQAIPDPALVDPPAAIAASTDSSSETASSMDPSDPNSTSNADNTTATSTTKTNSTSSLSTANNGRTISVFHFDRDPSKAHNIPFRFLLLPNEPWRLTKERLRRRTGYTEKAMEKMKFAVVGRGVFGGKADYFAGGSGGGGGGTTTGSAASVQGQGQGEEAVDEGEVILEAKMGHAGDELGIDHVNRSRAVGAGRGDVMMIR